MPNHSYFNKLLFLFFCMPFSASIAAEKTFYESIADNNLDSYPQRKSVDVNFELWAEWMAWELETQEHPEKYFQGEVRKLAFEIFKNYEKKHTQHTNNVLDTLTAEDLNLICGPDSNPGTHVLAHIDRTSTQLGSVTLAGMLMNPIYETHKLTARQNIVHELLDNKALFDTCDSTLNNLKTTQNLFLSFWAEHDGFKSGVTQKTIKIPWAKDLADDLNSNEYIMEAYERLSEAGEAFGIVSCAAGTVVLPVVGFLKLAGHRDRADRIANWGRDYLSVSNFASMFTVLGIASHITKKLFDNRVTQATNDILTGVQYSHYSYFSFDQIKGSLTFFNGIQKKLIAASRFIAALKSCNELIQNNAILKKSLEHGDELNRLVSDPDYCPDFHKLADLLATSTFQGEAGFFSRFGRLLAAFNLINKEHVKDALTCGCVALGELDAYISITRLYQEGQSQKNKWCFAEYMQPAPDYFAPNNRPHIWVNNTYDWSSCPEPAKHGPSIELTHFWNPLIDAEKAVANSMEMGTENSPRTAIITGPNAGGKSTCAIKGIPLCALLGQSLGMVPAQRARLTIFKKIIGYMNIVDDVAAGNSHFKAGVLRAQDVFKTVENLRDGELALVALDEVFDGTSYKESEIAAKTMVELIGNNPRILGLSATHFPLMVKLEKTQPDLFKNYKVSVDFDAHGRVVPRFKIEPGISDQHIAFDIIKQEGLSDGFLRQAAAEMEQVGS